MKIATIVGARPQFIKAATVSRAIAGHNARVFSNQQSTDKRSYITELIIHTGQHFDDNMSQVFFDELEIPRPDYHLDISGDGHGAMTGAMLAMLDPLLQEIQPDWVLVYGDTNSTLAGALAAAKLHIPVAHVESGLRSFNRRMPEEINRILADQLSTFLFCPTKTATKNLYTEGFPHLLSAGVKQQIVNTGDVMYDAALFYGDKAEKHSKVLAQYSLDRGQYVLATVHRAENTDDPVRLQAIFEGLQKLAMKIPVILPLHPRTRKQLEHYNLLPYVYALTGSKPLTPGSEKLPGPGVGLINPLGYLDMVALEKNAAVIATDSGGVQKEAYFHGVPCVTMREETEWTELVEAGWNRLAPPNNAGIAGSVLGAVDSKGQDVRPYGEGNAADLIVQNLISMSLVTK